METLLEPLLDSLDRRHEAMTSLLLTLRLDDRSQRTATLRPASPTLDRTQILDLLRLRMEATALPAGVTEIVMEVRGGRPDIRQGELFHGASAWDHDAANRALARLRARFGDGALVRRFFPKPVRLSYAGSSPTDAEPRVGEIRTDDSLFTRESSGPYIISGGWWGAGAGAYREYHFVRTGEGPWLWVYYDRKRQGWFLHGKVE